MRDLQENHRLVAATTLALGTGYLLYRKFSKPNLSDGLADGSLSTGTSQLHGLPIRRKNENKN